MNICLYGHSGSDNHGCEALVRTAYKVLKEKDRQFTLYSYKKDMDYKYGIDSIITQIVQYHRYFKVGSIRYIINYILRHIFKCDNYYYRYANHALIKNIKKDSIYFSIGGDNYCYGNFPKNLAYINKKLLKKVSTVLWGVSIEREIINRPSVIKDLKRYSLITARESLTYSALLEAGVSENTHLIPDTAFILPKVDRELPKGFIKNKTIGINLSPLIQNLENSKDITYLNYKELIDYIISETDNNVALIPHVVVNENNDLIPLAKLYEEFKHTNRIVLIGDHNCMGLKGFIAQCRMFVGARTHATIAAYSSLVPTLTVGYSIKAKGIAKDLFGDYKNYVIPVQQLTREVQLKEAFIWLSKHESDIRKHLKNILPSYIKQIDKASEMVDKLSLR